MNVIRQFIEENRELRNCDTDFYKKHPVIMGGVFCIYISALITTIIIFFILINTMYFFVSIFLLLPLCFIFIWIINELYQRCKLAFSELSNV